MTTAPAFIRNRRSLLFAGVASILACSPALAGEDAAEPQPPTVSDLTITAERESQDGYKVSESRTAMKTDTPLIDAPQSVTVVSVRQIQDQAALSIGDAIRYVPGVFSAQGEGNRETLVFRGNSATGDFFVDGVRDDVQTYRDLYNIDRLEIFRGPNAMIFGRGGIGGVINRVTKVAGWMPVNDIRLEGGAYDHARITVDVGRPVNDAFAVRLTGVYQGSESYRDGVTYDRWGINPTASWALGADTLVQAGYEHFEDDRIADRGVPAGFRGAGVAVVGPLPAPPGQFFGDPGASPTWTDTDAVNLFIEHRFSDRVSIRNRTRYAAYAKFYQNVFPGGVNAAETTVSISAYNDATERRNLINQTDLNARFAAGGMEHILLLGVELGRQTTDNRRQEGRFGGAASITVPMSGSNFSAPLTWTQVASNADNEGVARVAAGYVQDQIEITGAFQVVVGVRYENFKTEVDDRRTVGFPVGQARHVEVTDSLWSPRVGLIFKPVDNASLYASYSKTYQPRGGDQLSSLTLSNRNLEPETFENYEVGAKWDPRPDLNLAGAVFQLDRDNVLALSDPNNAGSPTIPVGRQRTRGLELSAAGRVTDALSLVAAYTYSDGTFLDDVSGAVRAGNQLANMPKHSASVWTRYQATDKFAGALGVIYQGERFASTDNLVALPAYTRVDAALYYDISDRFFAQLNVENLFDERYYLFAHSNNNITPGSPTAVKVGLSAKF